MMNTKLFYLLLVSVVITTASCSKEEDSLDNAATHAEAATETTKDVVDATEDLGKQADAAVEEAGAAVDAAVEEVGAAIDEAAEDAVKAPPPIDMAPHMGEMSMEELAAKKTAEAAEKEDGGTQ